MSRGATVPRQDVETLAVERPQWREACRRELDDGGRFCGAHASGHTGDRRWQALFARGSGTRALIVELDGDQLETIVDMVPAAQWDEREAHDLHGLRFEGHDPLRPLLDHSLDPSSWTVPVEGRGVHQVVVGPIHAGVIESGHFRFHVVGERILHLDPRLFYNHRGLERAAEGLELSDGLALAQRACGACAVTNAVAYAQACESVLGLLASRELRRARTLLLELERLYNHLNDIAAICAGVGFATGNMAFAALKERAMRLNQDLTGHRFLFGSVEVGANRLLLSGQASQRTREQLLELRQDAARLWREVRFSASVQARLDGVGVLDRATAAQLGAVGPAGRASGLGQDTRSDSPALWYGSSFVAAAPAETTGDIAARLEMRAVELEVTFELLDDLLPEPIEADAASPCGPKGSIGVARVESPRGETVCVVEHEAHLLRRLRLRTGSYANWPALVQATAGNLLSDFPLINKSFELCYACVDR
ncbi:MAG: NADH-quinone oxidoreductase subunit C [Solirubrobacterales bacterium]